MKNKIYIGGVWKDGQGENFTSHDPATGETIWNGKAANEGDVNAAVLAAKDAFIDWSRRAAEERISFVEKYREVVSSSAEEVALAIARETGKVLWDAKGEVQAVIGKIGISVQAWRERTGDKSMEANGARFTLTHKPHGVAAVFGPYNFPAHLPNGHIVPALIAGNTVVLKASDYTPGVSELMVKLWEEAGLPAGVINLVQGGRETGMALAAHTGIDALLFTGSVETGHALHRQLAGRPEVILALEMGGNNPLIVHEVEDIDGAALLAVQSAFITTGQRCTCARRLIVPEGAAGDDFLSALAGYAGKIRIGAYTETPEPYMGPLVSNREAERLMAAQEMLLSRGGDGIVVMQRPRVDLPFITPGIIDITKAEGVEDREYFGPLLQVIRVPGFDEAIREANRTRYGLSAGIFTDNAALYARFRAESRAGVLAWNKPTTGASSALPFGGIGASGNHRPSAYYAADYCAWPVAATEADRVVKPPMPAGIA